MLLVAKAMALTGALPFMHAGPIADVSFILPLQAEIDEAFSCTDREAVEMASYLLRNDGLFLGSSAAVNCVGAAKLARALGPGHTVVTILCDGGQRHLSRFYNSEYLERMGLTPQSQGIELSFIL